MGKILPSESKDLPFTDKLEFIRSSILSMSVDDSEAVALATATSVYMSLEFSGERDITQWLEDYSADSLEIAENYFEFFSLDKE